MIWRGIGKPRQGYEFDMMRFSKAQFKYALRSAKQHEGTLRRESLAKKLALSQPNKFWQEIRVMNGMDKTGRIDQVDNYRPIALASVISKVVEIILLSRISGLLETCHNQFG